MHTSLDQALGRQPRLNRVGQSLFNIAPGAAAAYSLRSLTGNEPKAVRIRRDGDNEERDFTTAEIETEAAAWTNGLQETTLPADLPSTSSSITGFTISGTADEASTTYSSDGTLLNGKLLFTYSSGDYNVQVRYDGSKWLIWDNFQSEAFWTPTNNQDTEFPWDVTAWTENTGGGGPPVFSSFVGGNPDNSAAAAYSLRKVKSDYTGPAVRIRRKSDDIEVNVSFDTNNEVSINSPVSDVVEEGGEEGDTTATTLGGFLTEEVTGYSSNFTTTDGWSGSSTTVTANVDANADGAGVPPSNDFLKLVANDRLSIRNNSVVNDFVQGSGSGDFEVTFDYYAPQDISTFKVIAFTSNGNPTAGANNQIVTGSGTFSATLTLTDAQASGLTDFRVGSTDDQAGKTLYIKNLQFKRSNHNAAVHTWYDQSGNSNDATQEADANQPLIAQDGNFLNELDFDGSEDMALATGSFSLTQAYTTFSVSHTDDASTSQGVWSTGSSITGTFNATSLFRGDDGFAVNSGITITTAGTINYVADRTYLQTNVVNGASSSIFVDGATGVTGNVGSTNPSGILILGFFRQNDGNNINLDGGIKELIIYNSDQTANRFKIESNINNHYGLYTAAQNGFVNTWYDQSGNSKNATAEADADEPEIVKDGNLLTDSGGRPEIQFDGTSHHFDIDFGSDLNQPNTIVMVNQSDTTTATKNEFFDREGTSVNPRTLFDQVSSNYRMLSAAAGNTGVAVDTNKNLVVASYNQDFSVLTKNGTAGSFFNSGTLGINQNSEIGRSDASPGNYDGTMQEFIIYSNQQIDQTALETNIANHYGITLS